MQRTRRALTGAFAMLLGTGASLTFPGCDFDEPLRWIGETVPVAPPDLGPPQRVFAKRFVTPIREGPSPRAARLGYLRAGALLHSTSTRPLGYDGCEGGWYELDTGGFSCNGRDILVFAGERLPELRARQPDRDAAMPYDYVTVRRKTPLYKRLPKIDEIYEVPSDALDAGVQADLPEPTRVDEAIDNPPVSRILQPGFYVSLDRPFQKDGQSYWRTQQNGFVSADALRRKPWSEFRGQELGIRPWGLPIAVTRGEDSAVYRLNDRGKLRVTRERLAPRTWLAVRARRRIGDSAYLLVDEDRLVREADVLSIRAKAPPPEVGEGERWIDIDLQHQVLVAYQWKQPLYVTLISTGRGRAPSPELDYRTPQGVYRIRAKHLTSTMDNDEPGAPAYSLEDVPYVMYFKGAYAFHSAFWHDRFGRPRSHGCINLAPRDAKWLYNWAGPDLPESWHGGGATESNPGTWVYIHGDTPGSRRAAKVP